MQLLVLITNQVDKIPNMMSHLMDTGITGATLVDCKGMLGALEKSSVEPPMIFGALRKFIDPENEENKMIMMLLSAAKMELAKGVIHKDIGKLNRPNTGVMFTVPILSMEGIPEE